MSISPTTRQVLEWNRTHAWLVDTLTAATVCLLDLPLGLLPLRTGVTLAEPTWLPLTVAVWTTIGVGLALRRRIPVASWALVTLAPLVHLVAVRALFPLEMGDAFFVVDSLSLTMLLGVPLTLVSLASVHRMRYAWAACLVSTGVVGGMYALTGSFTWRSLVTYLLPYALFAVIGTLVGLLLRVQRVQLEDVRARSARLALAAEQESRLAAANERSRIAREMHDIVAHSLAVMITMADGAAASVDRNPDMAKQALEVLADTGRSALADTRRLVGVLRDDPGATSAPAAARQPARSVPAQPAPGQPVASTTSISPARPAPLAQPVAPVQPARSVPTQPARTALTAGTNCPARASRREKEVTTSSIPVVRELPVPEFAPPGIVAPSEPSAPIAHLRQVATTDAADASTGEVPLAPAPESADLRTLVDRFRAAGVPVDYDWDGPALPEDKGLQLTVYRIAQEALTNVLRYAPMTRHVGVHLQRTTGAAVLTIENDAAPQASPMHGSGKGLIGMRERAAVYGGTVDAGPTPTGWRVRAVLRWDEDDQGASPWQLPR